MGANWKSAVGDAVPDALVESGTGVIISPVGMVSVTAGNKVREILGVGVSEGRLKTVGVDSFAAG